MDTKALEKKLSSVKDAAEDIQMLSRWCIQNKNHPHSIVHAWSRAVRKAKVGHRLTLFYVCNDIVQNSRRKKCMDLVQHFATAIKEAVPLVRDEKIKRKIQRIFNIWEERGIYDSKLVAEFIEISENVGTVNATENEVVLSSFQLVNLVEKVRNLMALQRTSECLLADLKSQENVMTPEEISRLQEKVKERCKSGEKLEEFEEAVLSLECYISSLQKEVEERTQVIDLLEQAEIFYETQRGEAKLVATAYKNFNSQVKSLKSKLSTMNSKPPAALALKRATPSPVPSLPSGDAPSPTGSEGEDICFLADRSSPMTTFSSDQGAGATSFMNSSAMASLAKRALHESHLDMGGAYNDSNQAGGWGSAKAPPRAWNAGPEDAPSNETSRSRSKDRSSEQESGSRSSRDLKRRRSSLARESEAEKHSNSVASNQVKGYMDSAPGGGDTFYKEPRPMSAKELFETFGKAYSSSSNNTKKSPPVPTTTMGPPNPHALPLATPSIPLPPSSGPVNVPLPPLPPIPMAPNHPPPSICLPPPVLPIPLPPNDPPMEPFNPGKMGFPLLPSPVEFPLVASAVQNVSANMWQQPPPPPPPPLPLPSNRDEDDIDWAEFEEELDNRNWGELPGAEELEALGEDTNRSPGSNAKEVISMGLSGSSYNLVSLSAPSPAKGNPPTFSGSRDNHLASVGAFSDVDYRAHSHSNAQTSSLISEMELFPEVSSDITRERSRIQMELDRVLDETADESDMEISSGSDDQDSKRRRKKRNSKKSDQRVATSTRNANHERPMGSGMDIVNTGMGKKNIGNGDSMPIIDNHSSGGATYPSKSTESRQREDYDHRLVSPFQTNIQEMRNDESDMDHRSSLMDALNVNSFTPRLLSPSFVRDVDQVSHALKSLREASASQWKSSESVTPVPRNEISLSEFVQSSEHQASHSPSSRKDESWREHVQSQNPSGAQTQSQQTQDASLGSTEHSNIPTTQVIQSLISSLSGRRDTNDDDQGLTNLEHAADSYGSEEQLEVRNLKDSHSYGPFDHRELGHSRDHDSFGPVKHLEPINPRDHQHSYDSDKHPMDHHGLYHEPPPALEQTNRPARFNTPSTPSRPTHTTLLPVRHPRSPLPRGHNNPQFPQHARRPLLHSPNKPEENWGASRQPRPNFARNPRPPQMFPERHRFPSFRGQMQHW